MSIQRTMSAWQVTAPGEPATAMTLARVSVPEPGPGQLLVEVWSTALNLPDVLLARGHYDEGPTLPFTPGLEMCGMVVAVGAGVAAHLVGERVIGTATLPHGTLARYALCAATDVFPAPPGLDDTAASAMHIAYQTSWFALYRRAALRVGETLLVHGAAGGVGSAAVQLGKAAGAKVIAVVGTAQKAHVAAGLGADVVVDRSSQDVVGVVTQATAGRGVDVVFDPVGGQAFEASTALVAFEGRIVVVGFAGGQIPAPALNHAVLKNYTILGLNWGQYRSQDPALVRRCHDDLCKLVAASVVKPLISQRLPFDQAVAGLTELAEGRSTGRIAVIPPE